MSGPVIVIGAGPAGLRAAEAAARGGCPVQIFDRMPTPARKLLMAGRGGLNLTNAEPFEDFAGRFGSAAAFLRPMLEAFTPDMARAWAADLGIETFVGSGRRVFPRGMKASGLLRAWLARLAGFGVQLRSRQRWLGWDDAGALRFAGPDGGVEAVSAAAVVLALGGASWSRLGSDGAWTSVLAEAGVGLSPFRPANMGFLVPWSGPFRARCEGRPVKTVTLSHGSARARGEFVVTGAGIEGGAVYALASALRDAIERDGHAIVSIDLKPDLSEEAVRERLGRGWGAQSTANVLRKALRLDEVQAALLREATPVEAMRDPIRLARTVKSLPLRLEGFAGLERAISSAGGIRLDEVDDELMLKRLPGVFVAGEMLDWEAPTGGYLLQACLATGDWAGKAAARRVNGRATEAPHR